jgi:hypothetical protein
VQRTEAFVEIKTTHLAQGAAHRSLCRNKNNTFSTRCSAPKPL